MGFAEELQKARKDKSISQEELAEMLGVSRQSVSKWERSEGYPEVETLIAIARNLHLSLDDLMHDELSQISDFETLSTLDAEIYGPKLKAVAMNTIVKACMGTSPTNFEWIAGFFPNINFNAEFARIGRIRVEDVEEAQKEILKVINS
ncbi:MAG: helix-turn-helix domain-containing protein [Butyrivibrio sp.]|nr:helix-turn-helix domain-containing protein [Butyrivibrio sp.]